MAAKGKISLEIELETKRARQQMQEMMQDQATAGSATRAGQRAATFTQQTQQAQRAAAIRNMGARSISAAEADIETIKARMSTGKLDALALKKEEANLKAAQRVRSDAVNTARKAQAAERELTRNERRTLKESQITQREKESLANRDEKFQAREENRQRLSDMKQPTRGQQLREAGGKMLGGFTNAAGTAMLVSSALTMHDIQTQTIERDLNRVREDTTRDAKQREQDWNRTVRESSRDFKNLERDRGKALDDYNGKTKEIARNESRALHDNNEQRIQLNNQAHRLNLAQSRQKEDYESAINEENANFARGLAKINLDRQRSERDYGRQTAQINLQQSRREEDAQANINQLLVKRDRFQRDMATAAERAVVQRARFEEDGQRDLNNLVKTRGRFERDTAVAVARDARDRAKFEERVADQQKEQLEEAQKRQKDLGLDRAIAGLGMLQAMRQGGMMGILQSYKQWQGLNEEEQKNQELIDRGGLTKEQQQGIDDARQGFDDRAQDRDTAVADFNQDMIDSFNQIQLALTRGREDFLADEKARQTQIADFNADLLTSFNEIQLNLQRSRDDSAQALTDATINYLDSVQNMNMATEELETRHVAAIEKINQQNERFWEDMALSRNEWWQQWEGLEEAARRIREDAHLQRMAAEKEYQNALYVLAEREHALIDNLGQALLMRQREEEQANINLKRAQENAETQQRIANEQLKMGLGFSIMFAGQTLAGLWGAVGALGTAATTLTGAGTGIAATAVAVASVVGVTLAAIAAAAAVVQIIGAITGIKELDLRKLPEAISGFSKIGDVMANPKAREELMKELGKLPGDLGAQMAAKWGPAPAPASATTPITVPQNQHGGIVSEPAFLIGMRNGRVLGTVAEKSAEIIKPTASQVIMQREEELRAAGGKFAGIRSYEDAVKARMRDIEDRQHIRKQIELDVRVKVDGYIPKDDFDRQLQDRILETMLEVADMAGVRAA
jgi:hypothetical protein